MTSSLSTLKFGHLRPPIRRVLAIDPGSSSIKLLLAASDFGRLRVVRAESIDLQKEGLVSAEETKAHLQTVLAEWDRPPLALVLPQHISISQVIDLPLVPESEVEKLIRDETLKLSGVSESRIVYDFVRTETPARNKQQFWVTLSQEGDVRDRIQRLGIEQEDLCEVTTTANALIASYLAISPQSNRAILVHMGAQTTVVVILVAGQAAFAASFQMGGDFLTRALARIRHCSEQAAEELKRSTDLLNGPEALLEFASIVDGWVAELKRQFGEWFENHPDAETQFAAFELAASGGPFDQPGFLEYLRTKGGLALRPWPQKAEADDKSPPKGFEVAFGAALQALGYSAQPVSLLPEDYWLVWKKRLARQKIEFANLVLVAVCVLLFAFGAWHQVSLIGRKQALLDKVKAAQEAVDANDALSAELASEYEALRPVFYGQQNTLDTLKTLALMQQSRSNRSFWYVLASDQHSYFRQPPALASTNRVSKTNLMAAVSDRFPDLPPTYAQAAAFTNASPAKPGLILELCVPEEPEVARATLGQLVKDLKKQTLFSKVDLLSDDLRRSLADPKVIIPDRYFVLALDFAETDFAPVPRGRKASDSPRPARRPGHPSSGTSDPADKTGQIAP